MNVLSGADISTDLMNSPVIMPTATESQDFDHSELFHDYPIWLFCKTIFAKMSSNFSVFLYNCKVNPICVTILPARLLFHSKQQKKLCICFASSSSKVWPSTKISWHCPVKFYKYLWAFSTIWHENKLWPDTESCEIVYRSQRKSIFRDITWNVAG